MKTILTGGSKQTAEFATYHRKPWIHLAQESATDPAGELVKFLKEHYIAVLNGGGPRASKELGVYQFTKTVLKLTSRPRVLSTAFIG